MISLPNGALVAIAATYGTAKNITGITNANPAVATFEIGHAIAAGDAIVLTSAWSKLTNRVVVAGIPVGDAIPLTGVNSLSTSRFPAGGGVGSAIEVLTWTQLAQILGSASSGGEQQFLEYQLLESDTQQRIPTTKSASGISFTVADDPALPGYQLASAANDDRAPRAVRITLPSGALIFYNAYISLNKTPTLTVNEIMAIEVTLSLLSEPMRYAAV